MRAVRAISRSPDRPRGRDRRRRGAALVEFVMCIPFLAFVIACIFFFGWAMMNQQHVWVSDRYTVWRDLYGWQEIHGTDGQVLSRGEALNLMFFANKADPVSVDGSGGWTPETISDLVTAAGERSAAAEELAQRSAEQSFPHGRTGEVAAEFPPTMAAWQHISGAIRSRHWREGVVWRRGEVSYLQIIQEQFLADLDEAVMDFQDPQLRDNLRALYRQRW